MVAPAVGPTVGGFLIQYLDWAADLEWVWEICLPQLQE